MRTGLVGGFAILAAALLWTDSPAGRPAAPPIVSVRADGGGSDVRATGFAVGRGRVVTVAHILDGVREVTVRSAGGSPLDARVLRRDRRADLALLTAPGMRARPIRVARPQAGSRVWSLVVREGRTAWRGAEMRRSIVAHVRAPQSERAHTRPALELEARAAAGDSGAPVLTEGGRLAGVLFARSRTRDHTVYAVEATALERLLRP